MSQHLHIIGICGTFMGNLALLATELGYRVTGSDLNSYPPMSDMLQAQDIKIAAGYHPDNLKTKPDMVAVGNTISRSNPEVNAMLDLGIDYTSGPQWLYENILKHRSVITVAGTHGKTTTSSMIASILTQAGYDPGYLIGGVLRDSSAARIGGGEWFVVEGDEYDTAYFDKRSKFIHYRPNIAVLLNLEYDHADIFESIEAIEKQFEYLVRTLPSTGQIISNFEDPRLQDVITRSSFTPSTRFSVSGSRDADWYAESSAEDYSKLTFHSHVHGSLPFQWQVPGQHNAANALAAVAAACHIGIKFEAAIKALEKFTPVKRRLEEYKTRRGSRLFDDFAHHPTAIRASIDAIAKHTKPSRVFAVFEPRSNTMRMGIHGKKLIEAFEQADFVYMYRAPNVIWNESERADDNFFVFDSVSGLLDALIEQVTASDSILIMSNGGFENLRSRLIAALQ